MDLSELERLRLHYASLADHELRAAHDQGPTGYRDREVWELVDGIFQQRFRSPGTGPSTPSTEPAPPPAPIPGLLEPPSGSLLAIRREIAAVLLLVWLLPFGIAALPTPGPQLGAVAYYLGLIALIAWLLLRDKGSLSAVGLQPIAWGRELRLGALLLVVTAIVSLSVGVILAQLGAAPPPFPFEPGESSAARALLPLILLAAAGFEEFVFRGFLITRLRDLGLAPMWAVVSSSVAFGVAHYAVTPGIHAFVVGLVLGAAFVRWRCLVGLALAHWLLNWGKVIVLERMMQL